MAFVIHLVGSPRTALIVSLLWLATALGLVSISGDRCEELSTKHQLYRDGHNPCGPLALAVICRLCGRELSLAEANNVVRTDAFGKSSMEALRDGLQSVGMHSMGLKLTSKSLADLGEPAILHLYDSHFAAVIPLADGSVVLVDPPNKTIVVDPAKLSGIWNGTALVVCATEQAVSRALRRIGIDRVKNDTSG